ncbi:MAG: hypothetical protein ACFE0J_06315 [Elainellaceae cyanobacterium]
MGKIQMPLDESELIQSPEKYLTLLFDRYKEAWSAKGRTDDGGRKISLDQEIQYLDGEIEKTQKRIEDLRVSQRSPNENYRNISRVWEDELHRIDFSKAESIIKHVFKPLKTKGGPALLLMKKGGDMGEKWCRQKLEHRIREDLGTFDKACVIEFRSHQTASASEFLKQLARDYAVTIQPAASNLEQMTAIVDKICNSLVGSNIFVLHVSIYKLSAKNRFLEWFVAEFWKQLVGKVPNTSQQGRKIRLIAVLSVRGSVPKACLPVELCCNKSTFDGSKILDLPLQKWSKTNIRDWIYDYSGLQRLPNPPRDEEIEQMASSIYESTSGLPFRVYHDLMETLDFIARRRIEGDGCTG